MEEKEKKPWRPPEAAHLPDPIAFAMQGFERFGLPKERLIPPLQTFDRVMQHSAFTENRWWENARQVTATASSEEQWRRVSIERARCLGEPWPDFDDIPVTSITEDFSQKCQNATIVFWSDGTKTVVNCMDNVETKKKIVDGKEVIIRKPRKCDTYSKEAGLAMAIVKKWAGNNGNYNNIFRKFIPEMAEEEKAAKKAKKAQKAEK